jgi:hypothetical protein
MALETDAIIEVTRRINPQYQHLELSLDSERLGRIKPGQSLLVRVDKGSFDPYLRQQWWPVGLSGERIVVERPAGEHYRPSQVISVFGYAGRPFRFRRTLRNVLLLAHDTPPSPLLMTVPWLLGNDIDVTLVLTGTATTYDTAHLSEQVEVKRGDEDSIAWDDQVMTLGWADQVFCVVGQADEHRNFNTVLERFRELRNDVPQQYLFGVFQTALPCGAGGCYACMVKTRKQNQLVCVDGPAFDLTQLILT